MSSPSWGYAFHNRAIFSVNGNEMGCSHKYGNTTYFHIKHQDIATMNIERDYLVMRKHLLSLETLHQWKHTSTLTEYYQQDGHIPFTIRDSVIGRAIWDGSEHLKMFRDYLLKVVFKRISFITSSKKLLQIKLEQVFNEILSIAHKKNKWKYLTSNIHFKEYKCNQDTLVTVI